MAKKIGKFLLFTTIAGAAAAGMYLYLKQKNDDSSKDLNDDFDDDVSDFFDDNKKTSSEREYVSLDRGTVAETSVSDTEASAKSEDAPETSSKNEEADDTED